MKDRVKKVMAQTFQIDAGQIPDDANPDTLAKWTSLNHVRLMAALEEEFGIFVSEEESIRLLHFRKLCEYVQRKLEE